MKNLHCDPPTFFMDAIRHFLMVGYVPIGEKARCPRQHPTFTVRCHATGHDQPDTALRTGAIKCRHPVEVTDLFKSGVHGSHQHAIGQGYKAKVEWLKQMRIVVHWTGPIEVCSTVSKVMTTVIIDAASIVHVASIVTISPMRYRCMNNKRRAGRTNSDGACRISTAGSRRCLASR